MASSSSQYFLLLCFFSVLITKPAFGAVYVNITLIEGSVEQGAVCLDGSPAGYFLDPGCGYGSNNWLILLEGGGWCSTPRQCSSRKHENTGSTVRRKNAYFTGILDNNETFNPDFFNWNRVYVAYCDGSSFMGDVEAVDPQTNLHYRGRRVFNAVMDELLAKGLNNADSVVLTGVSAGGLATILHCDSFRELVPNARRVKCVSDSGFFLHAENLPGVEKREDFYAKVVELHGLENNLPTSCLCRQTNPGLCLFPENLVDDIRTPLFLLESSFDSYQLFDNLAPYVGGKAEWQNCLNNSLSLCNSTQMGIMQEFQSTFLQTLQNLDYCPSRGLYIHTCYRHGHLIFKEGWQCSCVVNNTLGNKTIAGAIGDWFFDRATFQEIDTNVVARNCCGPMNSDAFIKKCIELNN